MTIHGALRAAADPAAAHPRAAGRVRRRTPVLLIHGNISSARFFGGLIWALAAAYGWPPTACTRWNRPSPAWPGRSDGPRLVWPGHLPAAADAAQLRGVLDRYAAAGGHYGRRCSPDAVTHRTWSAPARWRR